MTLIKRTKDKKSIVEKSREPLKTPLHQDFIVF